MRKTSAEIEGGVLSRCFIVLLIMTTARALPARAAVQAPRTPPTDTHASGQSTQVSGTRAPAGSGTADDILNALQRKRPQNDVIPSVDARAQGVTAPRLLIPEGARAIDLTGRLSHEGTWWQLTPSAAEIDVPVRLLPNNTLEGMVRSTAGSDDAQSFVVSGEMTVFQGENYLLPRLAARANTVPGVDVSTSTPTSEHSAIEAPVPSDASVEQVLDRLRDLRPEQEVITGHGAATSRLPGLASGVRAVIPEGTPLISRPGRLIMDGSWWTFVFESDHRDHPEPPMKLLPNQNVELMVQASERGSNGLVFVVSGEVTAFDGENYLLTRSAIRRVDLGNLRR